MIGCVYKHPSANVKEFTLKFEELLKEINLNGYDAYTLGDMNIDVLNHHTHQQTGRYLDMLYSLIKPNATLTDHTLYLYKYS